MDVTEKPIERKARSMWRRDRRSNVCTGHDLRRITFLFIIVIIVFRGRWKIFINIEKPLLRVT